MSDSLKHNDGVTVIVPCYNGAQFLSQSLASLEGQTVYPSEVIVIDDGSTDETRDVLEQYATASKFNVRVLSHPKGQNLGIGPTYRLGLNVATGAYVGFLEQDDVWERNIIEEKSRVLKKYPEVGVVFSNISVIDEKGSSRVQHQRRAIMGIPKDMPFNGFQALKKTNYGLTFSDIFIRRERMAESCIIDKPEGLQDWMLLLQVGQGAMFYYCTQTGIFWRKWQGSFNARHMKRLNYRFQKYKAVRRASRTVPFLQKRGKQISIVGAFDRLNYGDLLFPVLLMRAFESFGVRDFGWVCYSLREGDYLRIGSVETRSLKTLFSERSFQAGSVVIVAGGEVLGATWHKLHSYLLPIKLGALLRCIAGVLSPRLADQVSKWFFSVDSVAPFIFSPKDFNSQVKVAYHAVGGTNLERLNAGIRSEIIAQVQQAHYVSVREGLSKQILEKGTPSWQVPVVPDIAILASEYFPLSFLKQNVSRETHSLIDSHHRGYICFQTGKNQAQGFHRVIATELDRVQSTLGLGVVLLPIGRASGHEDQVALYNIQRMMTTPATMPSVYGIWDVMFLIARARIFAGTSLHGAITALSFSVPYLGLTNKVPKLEAFLACWSIQELARSTPFEQLLDRTQKVLQVPRHRLVTCSQEMMRLSRASIRDLLDTLQVR